MPSSIEVLFARKFLSLTVWNACIKGAEYTINPIIGDKCIVDGILLLVIEIIDQNCRKDGYEIAKEHEGKEYAIKPVLGREECSRCPCGRVKNSKSCHEGDGK